jgi:His/Glu/Gln/Arg/opine family amino acid ABC transporter permease subunit
MNLFDFTVVQDYSSVFLRGLLVTVFLTAVVIVLAGLLAIPLALARLANAMWIRWPATFFVELIRSTPLILQLIYIYYVLPSAGIKLDPMTAAVLGLTLNYSAYMSEVYRSGIQAIPRGQTEAARSLGLRWGPIFRLVVLPQAFRVVVPALGNYLIALFKDTALA